MEMENLSDQESRKRIGSPQIILDAPPPGKRVRESIEKSNRRLDDPDLNAQPPYIEMRNSPNFNTYDSPGIVPLKQEGLAIPKEEQYEILNSNVYSGIVNAKQLLPNQEDTEMWCKCVPFSDGVGGCGDGCDNRARRVECKMELCDVGNECENMPISNQLVEKVWLDQSKLVATQKVEAGRCLAQYTGEVISKDELDKRLSGHYRPGQKLYVLPLNETVVVDATNKGGICRLASHSCSPNTEIVPWMVEQDGEPQFVLAMYSLKPVEAGEPITYDYSAQLEVLKVTKYPCVCGSKRCKKLLGGSCTTRGPVQCTVCQIRLLETGVSGDVLLHPSMALPVCSPCKDQVLMADWRETNICRWCTKTNSEGISCSSCPAFFCRKCLNVNIGSGYIKLAIASLETWTCLLCNGSSLHQIKSTLQGITGQIAPINGTKTNIRSPGILRNFRPQTIRPSSPGVHRMVRPRTPGVNNRRVPRPGTPALSRGRLPTPSPRIIGQGVSIQRVVTPIPPPPRPRNENNDISKTMRQLQRYAGLSIQPVSEHAGEMEGIVKDLETAEKSIHEAVIEGRRAVAEKDRDSIRKSKDNIKECIRTARTKLTNAENKC